MLAKWLLFLSAIPTFLIPGVHAGLREISITDRSSVSESTMKSILESCYDGDSSFNTLGIIGDFNEFTDKSPTIRINLNDIQRYPSSNFKLTKVIIVIDSVRQLATHKQMLRDQGLWNHMASFFIISKKNFSCYNASDILSLTSKLEMINSIYICPESMNMSALYTVNQYANYAPHPWRIIEEYAEFTLFHQRFDKNLSCNSLNYDKTKKLNGHVIRVLALEFPGTYFDPKKNYWPEYGSINDTQPKMLSAVFRALNASCVLNIRTDRNTVFELVHTGVADLTYQLSTTEEFPTIKFLFPHNHVRIVALIKSSSEKSTLSKIFHLWGFSVKLLAFIALVILFLILFWKNNEFSSALLDVIRLMIYSSILTNIRSHSFRIFFTTILIMMVISNGVFQGRIAAFLTTRERNSPIERIQTLVKLGYKLYSTPAMNSTIQACCPECNTVTVAIKDCINHVFEDGLIACIVGEFVYRKVASKPLDLVKEPLDDTLLVTKCRDDWPLHDRMNDMWMRVFEAGLPKFWESPEAYKSLRKRQEEDSERLSTQYQPVKLYKLLFAFQFLAASLLFCTIVFIAELLVRKYGVST